MGCRIHRKPRRMSTGGVLGSTLGGATTGLSAGGPLGAIVGAGVGLVSGKIAEKKQYKQNQIMLRNQIADQSRLNFRPEYSPENIALMPLGGLIPYNNETVELEQGEPFMQPNGQIDKISDTAPTHAQGGVPITLPSGTKVLGKKPATDEKTFKQLGSKLERSQKKYQKVLDNNPSRLEEKTAMKMLDKIDREFNDLFTLQGEDVQTNAQFPNGGITGDPAIDSTLANYRPEYVQAQEYGDFDRADYGDLLQSVPQYAPGTDSVVATKNLYKGVPGYHYSLPGSEGGRMEKYTVGDTTRFAGSEVPQFARGGMIRKGRFGVQAGFGDPTNKQFISEVEGIDYGSDSPTLNMGSGNFGNVLSTAGTLAPVAYNLFQGMQKPEQVATNAFANPYESEVRATMRDRRYNVTPEIDAARLASATYARRLREGAPTQAQYLGGLQAGAIAEQRAVGQALARKQNIENQYLAEQAQVDMSLGQAESARQRYVEDINARSRAAGRQFTTQGLSQLGQFAQVKQQENNMMIRDMQRLNLLPALVQSFELGPDGQWRFKATGEVVDAVDVERYVKGQ